ncbi:MAG: TIGR02300 family protein, partial [Oceanicaulis sp.]|nr:TIGR02300 family protein [Oceanicaulis sp.]
MAKAELGTKRVCPETGKKFYDLNKDPIVSPFTGMEYPLSYYEEVSATLTKKAPKPEPEEEKEAEAETEDSSDEEEDDDAPELDEEPIDLGGDEDEDEAPVAKRATPAD